VSTLAGAAHASGYADGAGAAARFYLPTGVAVDGAGNVYVADAGNDTIRVVAPSGAVRTLAGMASPRGSADRVGSAARFKGPMGVATDRAGVAYVADFSNHTIRRITPSGAVSTLAGTAGVRGSADGRSAAAAQFNYPTAVAVDAAGNAYVADSKNHTIRKIATSGAVSTLAGTAGAAGSTDGAGAAARFDTPRGVAVDREGNVYVADSGTHTVRKVGPSGQVSTLAGRAGAAGAADGTGPAARFRTPKGVVVDGAGNVYVADSGNHAVRKIGPSGPVSTLAGRAGAAGGRRGADSTARFGDPTGLAVDGAGNVYVADPEHGSVHVIAPSGKVSAVAAHVHMGAAGVAVDGAGNVFVADHWKHVVRKIAPSGDAIALAGTVGKEGSADGAGDAAGFRFPKGVALGPAGEVYVADSGNDTIRKVDASGVVSTVAGTPRSTGAADGSAGAALLDSPGDVAVDGAGNVFVADAGNGAIRKIAPSGLVSTLAGHARERGSADGEGPAAPFEWPIGLAVDGAGYVYVADAQRHTISKVTPSGAVSTLAGAAGAPGSADGAGSSARFSTPSGLAVDGAGTVYVADCGNGTVRRIAPSGEVSTLAGTPVMRGNVDGTGSAARFDCPERVALDASGNLYVADSEANTVRKVTPAGAVTTVVGVLGWPAGNFLGPLPASLVKPRGVAVDPATGRLVITIDSAVLVATFPAR
jgi:sugar lactone lactonase YvrE